MMLTLAVYNRLSEEDITKGHRIAGTGTITTDGSVGRIGGMKQKTFAAIGVGARLLAAEGDFDIAFDAADGNIEVVAIASMDDTLTFLETLAPA